MKQLLILSLFILANLTSWGQKDSTILFESSKGKWPIPIKKVIGVEDNEERKHYTANLFDSLLRIQTDSACGVYVLHDARVVKIGEVDNDFYVVTKYANYFITYYSLTRPNIKEGDWITTGQFLSNLTKGWTEKYYTLGIGLYKDQKELSAKNWINW